MTVLREPDSRPPVPGAVGEDVPQQQRRYRPEIQGLRAVAVFLVVVYHVWLGRVSGGVDVFLFISAFLLTLSFTRRLETGRPVGLRRYWAHLFKRLLPAAVVTVLGTLLLVRWFFPESRWPTVIDQAWATLFYVQNWALALGSVDYYAADHSQASPLQHFWSLSVQGQVFLLWPLVFAAAALITRRTRLRLVPVLAVAFGTVFVVSLAWSVHSTATQQQFAYFDTRTRLWEFALASLVALAVPYVSLPRALRVLLGWIGLVGVAICGIVLDVQGGFPGYVALWPLVSAALVILAGETGSRWGVDRFLASGPLVRLGDLSYGLYLVHWPLLITWLVVSDREIAGPRSGAAIIVASLTLGWVLTRFVDRPARTWSWAERTPGHSLAVIGVAVLLVAAPLSTWHAGLQREAAHAAAEMGRNNPGAASLLPGHQDQADREAPTLPLASELKKEWVGLPEPCAGKFTPEQEALVEYCRQTPAVQDPERTIAVVGNSHMEQFMGALLPMAEERNWQVVAVLQPGCPFGVRPEGDACKEADDAALAYVEQIAPDAVLTTSTYAARMDGSAERVIEGFPELVDRLTGQGIDVVGFRDNPRLDFNPYECAERHGPDDPQCQVAVGQVLAPINPADVLAGRPGFTSLDLTDLICPDGTCRPVVGNVYVFMDPHHLTWTYTRTMGPAVEERLTAAGW
ncbi:acyltransferase family protein [Kocuria sp. U4B]